MEASWNYEGIFIIKVFFSPFKWDISWKIRINPKGSPKSCVTNWKQKFSTH